MPPHQSVTPSYIKSKSCGFEMAMASKYGKTVIPILYNVPFADWPPKKIGGVHMHNQFASPAWHAPMQCPGFPDDGFGVTP